MGCQRNFLKFEVSVILFSHLAGRQAGEAGRQAQRIFSPTRLNHDRLIPKYLCTKTKNGEGIDWENDPNVRRAFASASVGSWIAIANC